MISKKRVVIIDDHPLYREGLKSIIATDAAYEIAGEGGSGSQGLQITKKTKPDLALVDLTLPDRSGLDITREILACSPETRVLIVSMHVKSDYIVQAFQAGARGYLAKESAAEMLLRGMAEVLSGNYFMDAAVSHQVIKKLTGMPAAQQSGTCTAYEALSPREQEILVLLAEGLTTRQIADKLFISPKTVENHRSHIMRKLDLRNIIELTRYAAKQGLIDMDLWIR